jgi:hypothetical protein
MVVAIVTFGIASNAAFATVMSPLAEPAETCFNGEGIGFEKCLEPEASRKRYTPPNAYHLARRPPT